MITIPTFQITDEAHLLGLSFAAAQHNEQLRSQLPESEQASFVPVTREEFLQLTITKILAGWAAAESDHVYAQAKTSYESKSPDGKGAILAALGITRTYGF